MSTEQPHPRRATAAVRSVQAVTDAVIMAYIHEISARHGRSDKPAGTPSVREASA
jgi:hypothetical protein